MDDPNYPAYIRAVQAKQRAYVRQEMARMEAARELWRTFAAGMAALNLHPLNAMEIEDRARELRRMLDRVEETHGDSFVMRWAFADHEKEVAALMDIGYTRSAALYEIATRKGDGSDVKVAA